MFTEALESGVDLDELRWRQQRQPLVVRIEICDCGAAQTRTGASVDGELCEDQSLTTAALVALGSQRTRRYKCGIHETVLPRSGFARIGNHLDLLDLLACRDQLAHLAVA